MQKYKDHPISNLFPLMEGKDLELLTQDIMIHGCRSAITIFEGKILDGRNRYRACLRAKVEPIFIDLVGDKPLNFVISTNLQRRHLTVSQRAMIAAKMANAKPGNQFYGGASTTREQAANAMEVSKETVKDAKRVVREAPDKAREIERGEKTVKQAIREIRRDKHSDDPVDKIGFPIPDGILNDWNRAAEMAQYLTSRASQIKIALEEGLNKEDVIFGELNNGSLAAIKNLYGEVKRIDPHAVCTACDGHPKKCRTCQNKGFISKFLWDTVVPEETKQSRMK